MSESSQEIIDIVREHGPIDLDAIARKVTLLSDRAEIAKTLHNAKDRGHLLRRPDKCYVINGKNGAAHKLAPEAPPQALAEQLSEPGNVECTSEPPEMAEPKAPPPPERSVKGDTPKPPPRTLTELADKHTKPPRPHDELSRDDPIEAVLREAVQTAQHNLDAFIREAGDLARVMASLMEAHDKTVAALNHYHNSTT